MFDELKTDHNTNSQSICHDDQLSKFKCYLHSKRKHLQLSRGNKRLKNTKFMTHVTASANKNQKHKLDAISAKTHESKISQQIPVSSSDEKRDVQYSFGHAYEFWNEYSDNYSKSKYSSLKQEIITNRLYAIDTTAFDLAYSKAKYLVTTSNEIKCMKCNLEISSY
eukprot:412690_1